MGRSRKVPRAKRDMGTSDRRPNEYSPTLQLCASEAVISISAVPGIPLSGVLTYLSDEHSFIFEADDPSELTARAHGGTTSVVIDTLQIEVSCQTRRALYAWGYFPRNSWRAAHLHPPTANPGAIIFGQECPLEAGISIQIPGGREWLAEYDSTSGWLRITTSKSAGVNLTQIASGIILGEHDARLTTVWLHPAIG